ncbi:PREDICTED: E3 SUMO-protein ligase MMS21 [Ipomoea nil]|uniref:E3 SUMO-protein ligase MMS21 n=1 Tax=Ipomoea nil TaxID=35883 RepID=UPI000901BFA6|nr:PREDICTED: E3 SUMO-protein ligase MMS21 [Ipomoea nil]
MASTSGHRSVNPPGRLRTVTSMLESDNQTLLRDMRKAMTLMKEVAVDLEMDNKSERVKELEDGLIHLSKTYDDCVHLSSAIQSIGNLYEPGPQPTDFSKLFDAEIAKSKATSPRQNQPFVRQFREAVWIVHHSGQPMPGEEQEDIIMTSSEHNLLNVTCPITGRSVTELVEPVRSMDCKHIYGKNAIMEHIKDAGGRCPVAGCPKVLQAKRIVCDALLLIEIEELRTMGKQTAGSGVVEDFTVLPEAAEDDEE